MSELKTDVCIKRIDSDHRVKKAVGIEAKIKQLRNLEISDTCCTTKVSLEKNYIYKKKCFETYIFIASFNKLHYSYSDAYVGIQ